jgi:hypothetical protein
LARRAPEAARDLFRANEDRPVNLLRYSVFRIPAEHVKGRYQPLAGNLKMRNILRREEPQPALRHAAPRDLRVQRLQTAAPAHVRVRQHAPRAVHAAESFVRIRQIIGESPG